MINRTRSSQLEDRGFAKFLFGDVRMAWFWLVLRLYLGWQWFVAGQAKVTEDVWMNGGAALQGYWQGTVAIPEEGRPAITYGWYRDFLQFMLKREWYTWFGPTHRGRRTPARYRADPRHIHRHRRVLRRVSQFQLHAGGHGQHQPPALRDRPGPDPRLEDRRPFWPGRLDRSRARHPLKARHDVAPWSGIRGQQSRATD